MKVVNPNWRTAVRVGIAQRDISMTELNDLAGLKSREYASAVINGRVVSNSYAAGISKVLDITVPYLVDIPEADIS